LALVEIPLRGDQTKEVLRLVLPAVFGAGPLVPLDRAVHQQKVVQSHWTYR
jgi:hypothetical protein